MTSGAWLAAGLIIGVIFGGLADLWVGLDRRKRVKKIAVPGINTREVRVRLSAYDLERLLTGQVATPTQLNTNEISVKLLLQDIGWSAVCTAMDNAGLTRTGGSARHKNGDRAA